MRGALIFAGIVPLLLAGTAAFASQDSTRLYSRGLVEFHAGRYTEALTLFDRAVQADPADAHALYLRGLTRGRLGQLDDAIADLRASLALDPSLAEAQLELGVALIQTGSYQEALAPLGQAQKTPALEARASLFLGLAQLRLGSLEPARANFKRASLDPDLSLSASYYLGLVEYRQQQWTEAEQQFAEVARVSPDSTMGQEAAALLSQLRALEPRRYQLYGSLGFQYDSNVVLAPATNLPSISVSRQADGRAVLSAGGTYVPWRSKRAELLLNYDFFQGLQFNLTQFNLQQHRPSVRLLGNWDQVHAGLLGSYDYNLLQTDSFLQEATALPWINFDEADVGRTDFFYRMRYQDFLKSPYKGQLDNVDHTFGMQQYLFFEDVGRFVSLGYQLDFVDPTTVAGERFGYVGNQVNVAAGWTFPAATSAELSYSYQYQDYATASGGRIDQPSLIVLVVRKGLTEHLQLSAAYLGAFHNSNQAPYDYNRQIGSISLDAFY